MTSYGVLEDGMQLLSQNEQVRPRSGSNFSRANRETSFLSCLGAWVPLGSRRRWPSLRAAPAERVSSAVRYRSRIELVVSGAVDPAIGISPKLTSRTANADLPRGKSEKKGQKIYTPSSQPIQNTATLEEQNQTKPFLMLTFLVRFWDIADGPNISVHNISILDISGP
jgi:hypothetical protein